MSKNKTVGIIIKIVVLVLVAALLGAGIGLIYRYTNGFNENFKTFYLEYNGKKILQSSDEMGFIKGTEAKIGVRYTFDFGEEARDYSVKVYPNEEEKFTYTVGERILQWRASAVTEDLSAVFGLKKESTYFTLSVPSGMKVETMLGQLYPGQAVSVPDAEALNKKPLYRLEVSSYNKKVTYTIDFCVTDLMLEFDKEHIEFTGV